jgi:hypothetical protein
LAKAVDYAHSIEISAEIKLGEILLEMEKILRPKAKEQQGTRTDLSPILAKSSIDTRKAVADSVGVKHETLRKVKKIAEKREKAGVKIDPENNCTQGRTFPTH